MTAALALFPALSFVAGLLVGLLLRDAYELLHTGKGFLLSTARPLIARLPRGRTLGIWLVTAVLVVNAATGFLLIGTRAALEDQRSRFEDLVLCQSRASRQLGDALEARDAAITSTSADEIVLWTEYLHLFDLALKAEDAGDQDQLRRLNVRFSHTVETWVESLKETQRTRNANPYPDPDACVGRSGQ